MSCCTQITDLGCFTTCELIETGIIAGDVNYRIEWDWLGVANTVTVAGTSGSDLSVPGFIFNEFSSPVFKVYNLTDETYETVLTVECFGVQIRPTNTPGIGYDLASMASSTIQTDEFLGVSGWFVTATKPVTKLLGVYRNGNLRNSDTYTLVGQVLTFTDMILDNEDVQLIYLTP